MIILSYTKYIIFIILWICFWKIFNRLEITKIIFNVKRKPSLCGLCIVLFKLPYCMLDTFKCNCSLYQSTQISFCIVKLILKTYLQFYLQYHRENRKCLLKILFQMWLMFLLILIIYFLLITFNYFSNKQFWIKITLRVKNIGKI